MKRPSISVVMAAKNYARFLPMAVESVVAQTHTDWELVIVDDGSDDDTPQIARRYASDARIRYLRSDRLGQPRAKNLGAAHSRGEFIAYLDADDSWSPTKLEKQLAVFAGRPAVGVCFTRRTLMDEAGQLLPTNDPTPYRGQILELIFLRNFTCFSSVMLRRQVFDHVGAFDPEWDLSIDYDLWLRVAAHYEFEFVDEALVQYRTGHGNLSKKLYDRVSTAESIMTRALDRRGLAKRLHPNVIAEGYGSTYRSMGYTLRSSEPLTAAKWYWRALAHRNRPWQTLKGLIACMRAAMKPRSPGSPENATCNR